MLKRLAGLNKPLKYIGARCSGRGAAAQQGSATLRAPPSRRALTAPPARSDDAPVAARGRWRAQLRRRVLGPEHRRCALPRSVDDATLCGRSLLPLPRWRAGKVCVVWESPTLQVITTVFYVAI